jgi:hypothetical protein
MNVKRLESKHFILYYTKAPKPVNIWSEKYESYLPYMYV